MTAEMRAETDFLARELAAARLALGRIEAAAGARAPARGGARGSWRSAPGGSRRSRGLGVEQARERVDQLRLRAA